MNCANHADAAAVAYCRTCGKPLCANCTRPVKGVIYCEDCLGARMEGTVRPAAPGFVPGGYVPPAPTTIAPQAGSGGGPNPALAGILAGFFPFGVGAVYTGQYAKGLAHLAIFVLLIAGANASDHDHSEALGVACGLGIAFFIVYQIIDAVRSARAIQMAQPVPDPFGLAATFGGGEKIETSKIPTGAVVLILVGVLFLLHTLGLTEFGIERFWPFILIGLGGWLFARNWGLVSGGCKGCQCARCRTRRIMGPAMLLTVGFLFLLENLHAVSFGRTWPVILLVVGAVKLMQGNASLQGHVSAQPPYAQGGTIPPSAPPPISTPVQPVAPAAPSGAIPNDEVNRG
jgi:hypothetical protein